jgi:hypothetical protein
MALASAGARVTLSYRRGEFARPKADNVEKIKRLERDPGAGAARPAGSVRIVMPTEVVRIEPDRVVLRDASGAEIAIENDVVFTMIGREAPLDFFRRSKIPVRGEWRAGKAAAFAAFLVFCFFLYNWKGGGDLTHVFETRKLFPFNVPSLLARAGGAIAAAAARPANLLGTLALSLSEPGFYYSVAYCLAVTLFGIARIRRRRTPYVTVQTVTLIAIQLVPLFLLPYVLLPWWGHNGGFDAGWARTAADHLFPAAGYGQGREY